MALIEISALRDQSQSIHKTFSASKCFNSLWCRLVFVPPSYHKKWCFVKSSDFKTLELAYNFVGKAIVNKLTIVNNEEITVEGISSDFRHRHFTADERLAIVRTG